MEDKTNFIDKVIKDISLEKIEETYKKDIERNATLYKIIYSQLARNMSVKEIKMLYGEMGILVLIKILNDNNIPVPKNLEKEFYFNNFDKEIKPKEKYFDYFFHLVLIVSVILLFVKNFF